MRWKALSLSKSSAPRPDHQGSRSAVGEKGSRGLVRRAWGRFLTRPGMTGGEPRTTGVFPPEDRRRWITPSQPKPSPRPPSRRVGPQGRRNVPSGTGRCSWAAISLRRSSRSPARPARTGPRGWLWGGRRPTGHRAIIRHSCPAPKSQHGYPLERGRIKSTSDYLLPLASRPIRSGRRWNPLSSGVRFGQAPSSEASRSERT